MRKPKSSKMSLAGSLLIAAVLVFTTGSSIAMALQRARESTTIAPQSFGTAVAKCRGGRTAVSGGFAAPGFDLSGGPTVGRLGSKRVSKRGIETRPFNFGGQAGDLISYAYCARHGHGFRVRSATTRVEPNGLGSAVAKCPRHTIAVGGGFGTYRFSVDEGPQVITATSKRLSERRWKVVGINISMMRSGTLVAHAYCEAAPFDLVTRSKEVTATVGALETFNVRCPDGSKTFSGGFDGHVRLQGNQPRGTAAIASRRASGGRVWRTTMLSFFGADPSGSATAYAYCRQR